MLFENLSNEELERRRNAEAGRGPKALKPVAEMRLQGSVAAGGGLDNTNIGQVNQYRMTDEELEALAAESQKNRPLSWDCIKQFDFGGQGRSCKSWRCRSCKRFAVSRDAWRIQTAMEKDGRRWFFMVLTLSRSAHKRDLERNYRTWSKNWTRLLRNFKKVIGAIQFMQVIEMHKSGQPHANTLLTSDFLNSSSEADLKRIRRWLKDNLPSFGFGYQVHFEEVIPNLKSNCAKYVAGAGAKSSDHAIGAEVSKSSQLPVVAPRGSRRIRASKGLLPPESDYVNAWGSTQSDEEKNAGIQARVNDRAETFELYLKIWRDSRYIVET